MSKGNINVISFAAEKIKYIFQNNEKFRKWPEQPLYLKVYEEVPEHTSAINFVLDNLIIDGIEELDYWQLQKVALDYLTYGGFAIEVIRTRGGGKIYNYIDIGKCRLSPDMDKVGYAEDWDVYKVKIKWADKVTKDNQYGIYYFKSNKSRGIYPTPYYFSALKSLDTMSMISEYHNNSAKGGFTPNVVINFNNGEPDEDTKKKIEDKLKEKFTGASGQRFILSFNESKDTAVSIDKLEDDNLDTKFETLQKFIQNQIIVAHRITSGQLLGITPENQGFSKTEYEEAFSIFKEVVISTLRRELEYGLSQLIGKEIKLNTKEV